MKKKNHIDWYDVNVICKEYNKTKEHEMETHVQRVGGIQTGSGFSLVEGIRDISYNIPGLSRVKQFLKKVAPYIKVKKTIVIGRVKL